MVRIKFKIVHLNNISNMALHGKSYIRDMMPTNNLNIIKTDWSRKVTYLLTSASCDSVMKELNLIRFNDNYESLQIGLRSNRAKVHH